MHTTVVEDRPACGGEGTDTLGDLPEDLKRVLAYVPDVRKAFHGLSPAQKQDLVRWIESAIDPRHRRQRLDMALRSLR